MLNFIAVVHIVLAIALIVLVLVQDSKGGGALGMGGGSNSLLGATGAQTLAAKMTRVVAGFLALTCLFLTFKASETKRSVLDSTPAQAQVPPMTPGAAGNAPTSGTSGTGLNGAAATNTAGGTGVNGSATANSQNTGTATPPINNGPGNPPVVNTGGQPTTSTTSGLTTTTTTGTR